MNACPTDMKTIKFQLSPHKCVFSLITACFLVSFSTSLATGRDFEVATSYEYFEADGSNIKSLNRIYAGAEILPGLSFGQSIFSAAEGDAGGAFFWGFEGRKSFSLTNQISANAGLFVGGGGGANEVTGDGTMTQVRAGIDYKIDDQFSLQTSTTWTKISDTEIDKFGLSLGLSYAFAVKSDDKNSDVIDLPISRLAFTTTQLTALNNSVTRSGIDQPDISLVGAEFHSPVSQNSQVWIAADGAADGAEGYMEILAGLRTEVPLGDWRGFAGAGAGFGGGGQVDTGGGLLLTARLGAAIPLTRSLDLEAALVGLEAPDGAFDAVGLSLQVVKTFEKKSAPTPNTPQRWALSMGVSHQEPNDNFRVAGANRPEAPIMQESSLDLFISDGAYITGNAQTTISGNAGGYAIGLLGLGYEITLSENWFISAEGHLGAAGGGSVNAAGGLIGGARLEIDRAIWGKSRVSLGVGQLRSLNSGGMAPIITQIGIKIPFKT